MCARYSLGKVIGLERYLMIDASFIPTEHQQRHAIAPGTVIPTIDRTEGEWVLKERKWGLKPDWWKHAPVINVRSETALEKPLFRNLVPKQRCLIPVSGFFEWGELADGKQPFYFHRPDGQVFMLPAIWGLGEDGPQCALLTMEAIDLIAPMNDRMPCILEPDDAIGWLESPSPAEAIQVANQRISETYLDMYPVTRRVNRSAYDEPDAIEPLRQKEPDRVGQFSLF